MRTSKGAQPWQDNPNLTPTKWHRQWGVRHQEYAGEHSLEGDGPGPQLTPKVSNKAGKEKPRAEETPPQNEEVKEGEEDVALADAEAIVERMSRHAISRKDEKDVVNTVRQFMNKLAVTIKPNKTDLDNDIAHANEWNGDMCGGPKPSHIGLCHNARQSLGQTGALEEYDQYMETNDIDFAIIQEPMRSIGKETEARCNNKLRGRNAKVILIADGARPGEGTAIIIKKAWRGLWQNTKAIKGPLFSDARITRTIFKAGRNCMYHQLE